MFKNKHWKRAVLQGVISLPSKVFIQNGSELSFRDKKFVEHGVFFEPQAPDMLTLRMLEGTRAGLNDPHSKVRLRYDQN